MTAIRRTVDIVLGEASFSGVVPRRGTIAFDRRRARWVATTGEGGSEGEGEHAPPSSEPPPRADGDARVRSRWPSDAAAPAPAQLAPTASAAPRGFRLGPVLLMGVLGGFSGLAIGGLVYQYAPALDARGLVAEPMPMDVRTAVSRREPGALAPVPREAGSGTPAQLPTAIVAAGPRGVANVVARAVATVVAPPPGLACGPAAAPASQAPPCPDGRCAAAHEPSEASRCCAGGSHHG